jgi:hypothetical protein
MESPRPPASMSRPGGSPGSNDRSQTMSLVELARFDNRIEAELARLNLGSEGIEAVLFDAEMNSFGWGPLMPIRLMVIDDDVEAARAILAAN